MADRAPPIGYRTAALHFEPNKMGFAHCIRTIFIDPLLIAFDMMLVCFNQILINLVPPKISFKFQAFTYLKIF